MSARLLSGLLLGLVCLGPRAGQGQDTMHWQPNLEAAQRLAAQTNRLVLVHFCGAHCQPCARMDAEVFNQPGTGPALAANFICVKISRDESPQTTQLFNVRRIPTDMIVTPDNRVIARFEGFQPADQYVKNLNLAADDYRRAMTPMQGYGSPVGAASAVAAGAGRGASAEAPSAAPAAPYNPVRDTARYNQAPTQSAYAPEKYAEYLDHVRPTAVRGDLPVPASAVEQSALSGNAPSRGGGFAASAGEVAAGSAGPPNSSAARSQDWAPSNASAAPAPAASAPQRQWTRDSEPVSYVSNGPPPVANPAAPNGPPPSTADPRWASAAPAAQPQPSRPAAPVTQAQLPPGSPPLAMDGYCCVTLIDAHLHKSGKMPWQPGSPQWGAIHNGRTYVFVGAEEQRKFLANPQAYAPALDGNDPVAALDRSQAIPGSRKFGLTYQNRIYLFSSEDNLQRFVHNQSRYAADVVQARR